MLKDQSHANNNSFHAPSNTSLNPINKSTNKS